MTHAILVWLVMFGFVTKHLIIDFPLQGPFQYKNKGTYGHPGGILHAGLHTIGTVIVLMSIGITLLPALWVGWGEGMVHYHIDWAKMNLNTHFNLKPDNSEKFWWLLGLDQYLHYMTYLGIAWLFT